MLPKTLVQVIQNNGDGTFRLHWWAKIAACKYAECFAAGDYTKVWPCENYPTSRLYPVLLPKEKLKMGKSSVAVQPKLLKEVDIVQKEWAKKWWNLVKEAPCADQVDPAADSEVPCPEPHPKRARKNR